MGTTSTHSSKSSWPINKSVPRINSCGVKDLKHYTSSGWSAIGNLTMGNRPASFHTSQFLLLRENHFPISSLLSKAPPTHHSTLLTDRLTTTRADMMADLF